MAAYIAFIASLNLCIGYALGVYIGVLPGITPRRERDEEHDSHISLPTVEVDAPTADTQQQQATEEFGAEQPAAEVAEVMETAESADTIERSAVDNRADILEGLASFKQKLEVVSGKLAKAKENREAVDQCANEMKLANDEYLDHTSDAVDSLNNCDDELSDADENMRDLLNRQTEEVRRATEEIDELMADDDTEAVRQKLMQSSEQLVASAAVLEEAVPGDPEVSTDTEPNSVRQLSPESNSGGEPWSAEGLLASEDSQDEDEPLTAESLLGELLGSSATRAQQPRSADDSLALLDQLMDSIDEAIASSGDQRPLQVATLALQLDGDEAITHTEALLECIREIVAKELGPGQQVTSTPDGHLLLTLPGDNVAEANERCERLRLQVKETTFCRANTKVGVSLVCSLTDTKGAGDRDVVMQRLHECRDEAIKLGESRTFHHDGALAAPVPPMPLKVAAQVVEF